MESAASRLASLNGSQDMKCKSGERGVKRDCGSYRAELEERCSQKPYVKTYLPWQLMAFTVAKLRSGLRTGSIHGWSGVPSRHENNSTGVRPKVGQQRPQSIPAPSKLKS
jgi:hypothetical protein